MQAANIEADASAIPDSEYQLTKHEFSSLRHGKYSGNYDDYICYLPYFCLYLFVSSFFGYVRQINCLLIENSRGIYYALKP